MDTKLICSGLDNLEFEANIYWLNLINRDLLPLPDSTILKILSLLKIVICKADPKLNFLPMKMLNEINKFEELIHDVIK